MLVKSRSRVALLPQSDGGPTRGFSTRMGVHGHPKIYCRAVKASQMSIADARKVAFPRCASATVRWRTDTGFFDADGSSRASKDLLQSRQGKSNEHCGCS